MGALEDVMAKGPKTAVSMTFLELMQYLEQRAGLLPLVLEHMQWMAQTLHQAYHTDQTGTWIVCPKSICESTARLFMEVVKS